MKGPNGEDLPGAVLFCCNHNAVRSPMAEAMMKHLYGRQVFVDSVGLRAGEVDPFVAEVLGEQGLDLSRHRPKSWEELDESMFDLVISLTPEAHHRAMEMTRDNALEVEYWPTPDPTLVTGSRSQRLDAYRATRDGLAARIKARFAGRPAPEA
ncbi:MAG: arsenate reductase ArsC [Alphaproteobacteria bacterium]|nr:arsenate reductase ArsC [Alphaproteobacteria bacterium]